MNNIILKILNFLNRIFSYLNGKTNSLINKRNYTESIKISEFEYNPSGRYYKFYLTNEHLLEHKEALKGIYSSLMNNDKFRDFGFYKIIIISAIVKGGEYNFHHNILITNNTSFEDYYDKVKDVINSHYGKSEGIYMSNSVPLFKVLVWNMDSYRNKHIKITKSAVKGKFVTPNSKTLNSSPFALKNRRSFHSKNLTSGFPLVTNKSLFIRFFNNFIKPIKPSNFDSIIKPFATMDIETMDYQNKQVAVSISTAYYNSGLKSKIFLLDHNLFKTNSNMAINKLWCDYFNFIKKISTFLIQYSFTI